MRELCFSFRKFFIQTVSWLYKISDIRFDYRFQKRFMLYGNKLILRYEIEKFNARRYFFDLLRI